MSSSLPVVPPTPPISPPLAQDSNANIIAVKWQLESENADADADVTDSVVVQSDRLQPHELEEVPELGEDSEEDDEVTAEGTTEELPYFELTRRMHRLYATISTGRDQHVINNNSDVIKIRETCVEDLRFVACCLDGGDECETFATRLLHLGLVELCQQVCVWNFSDGWRSRGSRTTKSPPPNTAHQTTTDDATAKKKKSDQLTRELYLVMSSVVNLTDLSADACQRVIDIGFHRTLFGALRTSISPGVLSASCRPWSQSTADSVMSILYNVVQVLPEARELYRDEDAVRVLQEYRTNTSDAVSCMALILQSYVINAEENDLLGSAERTFAFLARELRGAVLDTDHRSLNGYRASELLEAINKLSIVDSNKKRIIESGTMASYVQLLAVDDEIKSVTHSGSINEQFAAAQGLWTLASSCPDDVRNQEGCVDRLTKLLRVSVNEGVRRQARGALDAIGVAVKEQSSNTWNPNDFGGRTSTTSTTIANRQLPTSGNGPSSLISSVGHIFISYNHGSRPICLRLRDWLRAAGFVVWIDADEMCESIADDIISGLDRASVVLICMTQKYYESPYCKKEVIYAAESLKDIIPLVLEPRYKPHGWLKFHVSDRLRYDFSRDEQFDESFPKLVSALNKIFEPLIAKLADKPDDPDKVDKAASVPTTHRPLEFPMRPQPPPSDHQPHSSFIQAVTSTSELATWTREQVLSWLDTYGMLHLSNSIFDGYNGEMLLELNMLKSEAPETFAVFSDHELRAGRLNTIDLLRLNRALRSLRSGQRTNQSKVL